MKILVISDTHGRAERLEEILEIEGQPDFLIHCGDIEGQEDYIRKTAGCPCYMVAGNNDWFSDLKKELTFTIDDYRFYVVHGHRQGVSLGSEHLRDEAMSRKVDVVLYGHTHRPYLDEGSHIVVMNPGSLTYPRQMGRKATYAVITIDREHEAHFQISQLYN